ncbi:peptidase inhibitor family I36 protein [Nocardiopsis sp. NPDC058789]|uniref:peptidase inhibitor family I36 protein n=1 Tax=Nocardiopsis sp. NPDC058789 TaxID=3346634 RepID=UPI003671BF10
MRRHTSPRALTAGLSKIGVLAAALAIPLTLMGAPAQAHEVDSPQPRVVAERVESSGTKVTTFSDGGVVRDAPAGSVEAMDTSCSSNSICLWGGTNYTGRKVSTNVSLGCWTLIGPMNTRSLKTGSNRSLLGLYSGRQCTGSVSPSYGPGSSAPSVYYATASAL